MSPYAHLTRLPARCWHNHASSSGRRCDTAVLVGLSMTGCSDGSCPLTPHWPGIHWSPACRQPLSWVNSHPQVLYVASARKATTLPISVPWPPCSSSYMCLPPLQSHRQQPSTAHPSALRPCYAYASPGTRDNATGHIAHSATLAQRARRTTRLGTAPIRPQNRSTRSHPGQPPGLTASNNTHCHVINHSKLRHPPYTIGPSPVTILPYSP